MPSKAEEAQPGEEEHFSPRAQPAVPLPAALEKPPLNREPSAHLKGPISESQPSRQENETRRDSRDVLGSQKPGTRARAAQRKSIMEEILVGESPDLRNTKSLWEPDGFPPPEWNLCLEDFRKVLA